MVLNFGCVYHDYKKTDLICEMSEFSNNIIKDLLTEILLIAPTIRACRKKKMGWLEIVTYLRHRILSSDKYRSGKPIWVSPERLPLYNRREIILYRELIIFDEYETALWRSDFQKENAPLVLDVGANVGLFSTLCHCLNPATRLKCFEMVGECKAIIAHRLSESGATDFEIIMGAVGARDSGTVTIHYDMPYSMGNTVNRSTGRFQETVPCISLDGWWKRHSAHDPQPPFLIKIDVEGAERETIAGGANCIAAADYILIELHSLDDRSLIDKISSSHELISDKKKFGFMWVCVFRKRNR